MKPDETDPSPLPAWAHRTGLLDLGDGVAGEDDARDRALVCERIARYCWAYDERRIERLAACFTEDAVWEGDVLGRVRIGPFVGRAAIVKWLADFWPHQHDQRRHVLANTMVERLDGETATTLSYLLLMSSTGAAARLETTGFYRTDYRRTPDGWLIARLSAGFDAPFWPGELDRLSARGRARHGIAAAAPPPD